MEKSHSCLFSIIKTLSAIRSSYTDYCNTLTANCDENTGCSVSRSFLMRPTPCGSASARNDCGLLNLVSIGTTYYESA